MFSTRKGAAKLSLLAIIGLIALKVVVAITTGSISIFAQALDSVLDLFAVIITLLAIDIATRPADKEHPFGHGKVENIAAVTQGVLIFTTAGLIIYAAIGRIIMGEPLKMTEAGIAVMAASIVVSVFLSRHLLKVSKATSSAALEASASNIAADVYSAAGVLAGLIIIRFTRLNIFDPIIALVVAAFIIKAAYEVMRKSFGGLIDTRLPQAEEDKIRLCIREQGCQLVDFHNLRTRKAGSQRYVDLHLIMPKEATVEEAHWLCDRLEQTIEQRLPNTSVTIHIEPSSEGCEQCTISCVLRDKAD